MSRSYKRIPVIKFGGEGKKAKKRANKIVRNNENELSGKSKDYKKLFESWNIQDFRRYMKKTDYSDKNDTIKWKRFFRK